MPQKPDPTPEPTRIISPGVLAGRLYERIVDYRTKCEAEIAASPESIRERWAAKEAKAFAEAGDEVATLARGMLATKATRD